MPDAVAPGDAFVDPRAADELPARERLGQRARAAVEADGVRGLSQPGPGVYRAGMKSYGRAPTLLALTGYEQVRSIAAAFAGDHATARRLRRRRRERRLLPGRRGAGAAPAEPPAAQETAPNTGRPGATSSSSGTPMFWQAVSSQRPSSLAMIHSGEPTSMPSGVV